jgi:hypothetical protein
LFVAAASDLALELISLVFIVGGFVGCGLLWYFMVVRGSRVERAEAEGRADVKIEHLDFKADEPE